VVLDNYDSFTYNLVQYIGEAGFPLKVYRNDAVSVEAIERLAPSRVVISPGPGRPEDAGISGEVVRRFAGRVPILGVCLGHQCIGQVYGGRIVRARCLMHGKTSRVTHDGKGIFEGVENPFSATRYHSLAVEKASFPGSLEITATSDDGEIMGLRHKLFPVFGVQFHPESILTVRGREILHNFLRKPWSEKR